MPPTCRRDPALAPLRRQLVSQLLRAKAAYTRADRESDRTWWLCQASGSLDCLNAYREASDELLRRYLKLNSIRNQLRVANGLPTLSLPE